MFVCDNRLVFLLNIEGNHWFTDITQAERRESEGEGEKKACHIRLQQKNGGLFLKWRTGTFSIWLTAFTCGHHGSSARADLVIYHGTRCFPETNSLKIDFRRFRKPVHVADNRLSSLKAIAKVACIWCVSRLLNPLHGARALGYWSWQWYF